MIAIVSLIIALINLVISISLYLKTKSYVQRSMATKNISMLNIALENIDPVRRHAKSIEEKAEDNGKEIDSIRTRLDTLTFTDEQITTLKLIADRTTVQPIEFPNFGA